MCFAPEADLAVGTIVVAIGVDALRHVRTPRQIPLASVPIVLGVHQITETFVWWGLQDRVGHTIEQAALWSYLIVAFVVVPVLITVSVGLVERSRARMLVIAAFASLAAVVAVALGLAILRGNISAAIESNHLAYQVDALGHGGLLTELYVIANVRRAAGQQLSGPRDPRCAEPRRGTRARVDYPERVGVPVVLLGRDRQPDDRLPPAA